MGTVTNAVLRIYNKDADMAVQVHESASNSWAETSLTWVNAPGTTGGILDTQAVSAIESWCEFDVTSAVSGDGTYSFVLKERMYIAIAGQTCPAPQQRLHLLFEPEIKYVMDARLTRSGPTGGALSSGFGYHPSLE
jgi:hypothetical protein